MSVLMGKSTGKNWSNSIPASDCRLTSSTLPHPSFPHPSLNAPCFANHRGLRISSNSHSTKDLLMLRYNTHPALRGTPYLIPVSSIDLRHLTHGDGIRSSPRVPSPFLFCLG